MASTSCLITSTPDFSPPDRTRPFLLVDTADPNPHGVLLINTLEKLQAGETSFSFGADFVSEDQGDDVFGHLYIDYGMSKFPPAIDVITEIDAVKAGTMADAKRRIKGTWNVANSVFNSGCHTVTLIVAHDFDSGTSCPVCRSDSTQLTWRVFFCDPNTPAANCVPDFTKCDTQTFAQGCGEVANPEVGAQCGALP